MSIVIIGGGPGGAAASISLAEHGVRSVIVERDAFPRFHIGESMTGGCGEVLRSLGLESLLSARTHPVKYGVSVFGPGKGSFWVPVMKRGAGGELEASSTWQVRRSEFDRDLLEAAVARGAEVVHGQAVDVIRGAQGQVCGAVVRDAAGRLTELRGDVVLDASGQRTFLSGAGVAGRRVGGKYDRQVAIYSHLRGARRDAGPSGGNTLIFYRETNHWAWFIPIDDEIVSVGVVSPSDAFKASGLSRDEFYRAGLTSIHPELTQRVAQAELVEEVRASSNYSYRIEGYTGTNFLCVGDAHRFVDPIFSFGLHFAIQEGKLAADHIARFLAQGGEGGNPFAGFEATADRGMDVIEDAIDLFWTNPLAFAFLVHHHRYRDDMIDVFAGRVYDERPTLAIKKMRRALQTAAESGDSVFQIGS
ncbi:MAG: tryptophan 7-halogenase [Nannocystaceae bacterium]